jgi:hypothetical protein
VSAARARVMGISVTATRGKKPSTRVATSSSRRTSVRIEPPISFEPRLGTTTGTLSRSESLSSASLAPRQAWASARVCQGSSRVPCSASLRVTV